jgi:hypothetical protein
MAGEVHGIHFGVGHPDAGRIGVSSSWQRTLRPVVVVVAAIAALSELMWARLRGVRIYDLTDFYERFPFKLPVLNLRDGWLILAHGFDLLNHTSRCGRSG